MTETAAPNYPPIARAAHVWGDVILLATFQKDGSVSDTKVLYGPKMLHQAAIDYVRGWQANSYGGTRTCPVVISFKIWESGDACQIDAPARPPERRDAQYVTVYGHVSSLCDPSGDPNRTPSNLT